jgi:hypothetical protein
MPGSRRSSRYLGFVQRGVPDCLFSRRNLLDIEAETPEFV